MATEIVTSFEQQCDSASVPLSGALVYVYNVTTTTLQSLFSDTGLSVSVANPIVCDSAGRHDMVYKATGSYKIVVKTSAGVTVYTRDNIDGRVPVGSGALAIANGGTAATTAAAAVAALGAATAEVAAIAADLASLSGTLASTAQTHLATGTTAQRPASPAEGDVRRNTTTALFEAYGVSAWANIATYPNSTPHPTVQTLTSGTGATYTTPSGVTRLRIRMVGGGGGGGAVATNAGTAGTSSSWAVSGGTTWTAVFGAGGIVLQTGGAGGTGGVDGTGTKIVRLNGQAGQSTIVNSGVGGSGGGTVLMPGAADTQVVGTGNSAVTNTGGGGAGGSNGSGNNTPGGGGGGEYVEFWLTGSQVKTTHTYTVGAAGAGGAAGTRAGGNGAAGIIIVEEFYL
jgi:hypothetical protein